MDLLVLADADGAVDMTASAIARRTNVPLEIVQKALEELASPDPASRSKGEEGRRIIPLDSARGWGWRIVNYLHYRKLLDEDARRSYFRDYRRQERAKKAGVQSVQDCSLKFTQEDEEEEGDEEVLGVGRVDDAPQRKKQSRKAEPINSEWLDSLKADYPHVSIHIEFRKMTHWCDVKKKQASRARFINWINRIEPPPETNKQEAGLFLKR
jgi:hypothetical protein